MQPSRFDTTAPSGDVNAGAADTRAVRAFERDFSRLCETFDASGAAMGRRLHGVIALRSAQL
jgi:hypothetical protein